ncbi:MAG: hypothetical protein QM488_02635 [Rhizobiaceae bacterium]
MPAFNPVIVSGEIDVEGRLADLELTTDQIISIGRVARSRHDDASPLMPMNAPGSLAYIYGVEEMRNQIIDADWVADREMGVEAVVNRRLGVRIAYQNVDKACSLHWKPHPRSAKGTGSENLCGPTLFEHAGVDPGPLTNIKRDALATYYVMVAEDGSIELSRPIIQNKTFYDFHERIFVNNLSDPWEDAIDTDNSPVDDFDIEVSLKDEA